MALVGTCDGGGDSFLLDCFNGITEIEAVVVNYDSSYSILWSNLDSTKENGLIVGADTKWDRLLNGHEYTNEDGNIVEWKSRRKF